MTRIRGLQHCIVDAKGRITLPQHFAQLLEDAEAVLFYWEYPAPHLRLVSEEEFEALADRLLEKADSDFTAMLLEDDLYCASALVHLDSRRRLVIPLQLREPAQIEREVVVLGENDHLAIYSKDIHQARGASHHQVA